MYEILRKYTVLRKRYEKSKRISPGSREGKCWTERNDMSLEKIYKEETGNNAMYEMEDPKNCNQSDLYYYDAYVEWIEEYHDSLFAVLEKIIEAHKMSEVDWDAMREAEKLLLRTKRNAGGANAKQI